MSADVVQTDVMNNNDNPIKPSVPPEVGAPMYEVLRELQNALFWRAVDCRVCYDAPLKDDRHVLVMVDDNDVIVEITAADPAREETFRVPRETENLADAIVEKVMENHGSENAGLDTDHCKVDLARSYWRRACRVYDVY
ncbi:MAG: hypothetical protein GXX96_24360 [Planctomycetaceae bacterium]|nr:hypothetical protein [Planctomycetaceae bacterium]